MKKLFGTLLAGLLLGMVMVGCNNPVAGDNGDTVVPPADTKDFTGWIKTNYENDQQSWFFYFKDSKLTRMGITTTEYFWDIEKDGFDVSKGYIKGADYSTVYNEQIQTKLIVTRDTPSWKQF